MRKEGEGREGKGGGGERKIDKGDVTWSKVGQENA